MGASGRRGNFCASAAAPSSRPTPSVISCRESADRQRERLPSGDVDGAVMIPFISVSPNPFPMAKRIKNKSLKRWKSPQPPAKEGCLRIVGGKYRGRQLAYSGDPRTRPMKDNVREALFNLVGAYVPGKHIFDLFAGTGAIGLEALSRGAAHATMIEQHIPTARIIESNSDSLTARAQTTVVTSDTFFWQREFTATPERFPVEPWGVFCCPPYALYESHRDEMLELIGRFIEVAPEGSFLVCETDSTFRFRSLPDYPKWRIKHYSPPVLCVYRKWDDSADEPDSTA